MRKLCMLSLDSLLGKRLTIWWVNIESMTSVPSSVLKDIFKSCVIYVEILLRQRMHAFIFVIFINKALWALSITITSSVRRKNILKWMMLLWLTVWREMSIMPFSLPPFSDKPQKISDPLSFMNMFKFSSKQMKSYNNSSIINFVLLQLLMLHQPSSKLPPL